MNRDDTLILFGRSPFINQIKDKIPELIKNWHTMGCNYFCNTFPDVEYVIFYDDILPDVKDSTVITTIRNEDNEVVKSHKHELYYVKRDEWKFTDDKTKLHLCVHTPSMALNWAWQKGFKNVVLAGIDLVPNTEHFDSSKKIFSDKAIEEARKHLEVIAKRYLNIYQLNPDSYLDLPKVDINSLLAISINILFFISSEIPSLITQCGV